MKTTKIQGKVAYVLACAMGLVFILTACSSDDVAQVLADEFVAISGKISSTANPEPAGEPGVIIKGIYSDNDPLNPDVNSGADGTFRLIVLRNTAVSLQASKGNFATLNSAKELLNIDVAGFDIFMPTTAEAEGIIFEAFGAGPTLAGQAWLVVDVVDGNTGDDVDGVAISTTITPIDLVYTDCAGVGTASTVTVVDVIPCTRDGAMYLAYFDQDSTEITVSVGATQQLAPIRRGEVTFLEFEQ